MKKKNTVIVRPHLAGCERSNFAGAAGFFNAKQGEEKKTDKNDIK